MVVEDYSCWLSKFKECSYSGRLLKKLLLLNKTNQNKIDITEVKKAIYYAKKYHANQKRQSGEPYYSHPLEVAFMISDYLPKTDIIITSILHDCIEDTALSFEMIKLLFGLTVAEQVYDLTRIKAKGHKISSAELVDSLWQQRKYEVLIVKIFDRLHNMQTINAKSPEKIATIVKETLRYFLPLSEVLETPELCDYLYAECYKANLKLGVINESKCIFDQPLNFVGLPVFENTIR